MTACCGTSRGLFFFTMFSFISITQSRKWSHQEDICGLLLIPKLAFLTMMVLLQSDCEQKSTKTSCKEVLRELG